MASQGHTTATAGDASAPLPAASRRLVPPFTLETALAKVKAGEDGWNSRDPERVALAYTVDSQWRNRTEFLTGRQEIIAFLRRKWAKETQYRLMKELWCYAGNRISVRFEYEWFSVEHSQWYRTHGNEHWEFDADGLMARRDMSANDYPISRSERRIGITAADNVSHAPGWQH